MRKRLVVVIALALCSMPIGAGSANAAAQIQDAFHGAFGEAAWTTSSTSFGWSLVSRELDGTTHLSIHQFSDATVDGDGNVLAGHELRGETTQNVSFTIDTVHFTGAAAQGVIPLEACTIVDGSETGCAAAGSATLAITWVGVGPIPHFPSTDLSWDDCLQVDRNSSVEREATITVSLSLNGHATPATQNGFAGFGKGNSRLIFACPS